MTPLGAVHAASAEERMRSERSKGLVKLNILLDSRLIDYRTVFEGSYLIYSSRSPRQAVRIVTGLDAPDDFHRPQIDDGNIAIR
jgi:hypothetical protein